MHLVQRRILELAEKRNIGQLTLREIGELVGEPHPQKIKHHISQLQRKSFLLVDKRKKLVKPRSIAGGRGVFAAVPIMGSANCGEALELAENRVEGFLQLSRSMLPRRRGIYALKAVGTSMNQAKAGTTRKGIDEGDYVLVDGEDREARDGDYVVSVIDGAANIKRFVRDEENRQVVLLSESTEDYPPIHLDFEDFEPDYMIGGKVIRVIKRPKH